MINRYESILDQWESDSVEFCGRSKLLVVANWPRGGRNCHCNVGSPGVSAVSHRETQQPGRLLFRPGSWNDVSSEQLGVFLGSHVRFLHPLCNFVLLHLFCFHCFHLLFVARFEEEALCALLQLAGRPLTFRTSDCLVLYVLSSHSTQICWDSILQTCPQLLLDHWLAGSCSFFFMTLQKVALTDTIAKRGSVDSIRFWSCSLL